MRNTTYTRPSMLRRKQGGFTALELGLVLLVAAIIIAGAVVYYRENLRKTSITSNMGNILSIASTAKSKYGLQNLYSQVTTALAVQGQVIPGALRDGTANTATNPFGGAIALAPVTLVGANDGLRLDWTNTPGNQCSDIVTSVQGEFRQISVAGVDVKPLDGTLNLATLEAQCQSAANVNVQYFIGRS